MTALRTFLLGHRLWAAWAIAAALVMRVLVPSGFMLGTTPAGTITVELCSGTGPMTMRMPMTPAMPMKGMDHHGDGHEDKSSPCAFSGLAAPGLAAADPVLLAAAIAFIVATVYRIADRPSPAATPPFLRPPLRGPPARA